MAPGKKQKKSKSKGSKDSPSGLSHIAAQLIPSAIFAAVPRTPTNLAQTWPRRTPSPIAQAISEAGNIGRVMVGDSSKRPPAEIPANQGDEERVQYNSEFEEVGYESVRDGKSFDKTTKYFRMSRGGDSSGAAREEVEGATGAGSSSQQHLYHILDHENGEIVEPVYSRVDKKRKSGPTQPGDGENDEKDSLSEYSSSDELTDVTSHDEESTTSGSRARKHSRKGSKKEKHGDNDAADGRKLSVKKSSMKRQTPDTIQEVCEEAEDGAVPPPIPPFLGGDSTPEAPKRGSRKKGQTPTQDELDGPGAPLPPVPRDEPENRLTDEQRRALKVVERLGFEGVSQKLALSDLSEDDDSYMSPVVPKNTVDFNGRTTFEREQFNDTLTESPVPVSEARIQEASLDLSHTFAGVDNLELQEELQSPNEEVRAGAGQVGGHPGFKAQARKVNKVSSFVQLLNEQERHRQAESTAHLPVKVRRDSSPSQSRSRENERYVDPVLIQRLEEARQANETSFAERQRQLETLVEQQRALYHEQLEQQKIQQQQQQEVVRQQWKLQEQLRALEKMQQDFNENADLSPQRPAVSASDVRLQRELVQQQQEFLQQQQEQLLQSQNQHAQALKQQDKLCDQIKHLEAQQEQLQSSVDLLNPTGEDLAEIKQQEQQIVSLLNEQRRQESELQRLYALQQQRLEEQSNSFTHERKALEQNQEMLQAKINEQEAKSRQLEQELEEMARKHADAETEWKKRISLVNAERADVDRKERLDEREAQDKLNTPKYNEERLDRRDGQDKLKTSLNYNEERLDKRSDRDKFKTSNYNKEMLDRRYHQEKRNYDKEKERRRKFHVSEYSYFDGERHGQNSRGSDLYHGEIEGKHRRSSWHSSYTDADTEESYRDRRVESSRRVGRGSKKLHHADTAVHWRDGEAESPTGGRKVHEKSQRKSRKTRERNADSDETVVTKTQAAVTEVQVVRDDEIYRLSKGRIELLESEKSALMELSTSLQEENKAVKQLALSLQKGTGVSSVVLQKQIKDLHQEHKVLRDTVHRLNVELSRYQAKYRPVSFEEVEGMALPLKKEAAPWLVNTKFLAPLFLAYDDRLKEKDQLIRTYDEELNAFKARVMEVVKENQQLHMSVSKSSPDSLHPDEWQQLQTQAKLVVEENALLMEQHEIQDRKMKEMQRIHGQEVSKLSKRISSQESTQRRLDTELDDMRRTHSNLLRKHESIVMEQEHNISVQEHLKIMDDCRSVLEDLKAKTKLESEEYNSRLQAIQKEKSSVAIKFADAEARNAQLERELEAYKKSLNKSERKFLFLQRKLEHIQERELTAQETLSQVLTVAEKTATERDNYVQFAKTQKVQQEKAASKILAGTQNIKGLEEKLQEYRKKATDKVAVVTGRLREKEKEINKLREQHEAEINNLRGLVRQKQRQLELMIGENRNVDKELELVWRNAAADNKRMKNTVRQKGGMFDSDSDPNAHLSSEEGEAA